MKETDAMNDDAFDQELAQILGQAPADPAGLSRAVLSRLVTDTSTPHRWAEVLAEPAPASAAFGAALLVAAALGYALVPALGGEDLVALLAFGDLLPIMGGL